MTFLASAYWRGSLNVDQMRIFPTEQDAIAYVNTLSNCKLNGVVCGSLCRVYELYQNQPPRKVKI